MIITEHYEPTVRPQVPHSIAYHDNNKKFPFYYYKLSVCLSLPVFGIYSHSPRTADNVGAVSLCEMS